MMRRTRAGLSYIELMVVVTVMTVLTALVLPTGIHLRRRAQEEELRKALVKVRAALDAYHRDWEKGCVEPKDERGWPDDLQSLHDGVEWSEAPQCREQSPSGTPQPMRMGEDDEPQKKVYLAHLPVDPFNTHDDEWDVSGWKARSYDDEPDSTSWSGEGVYDVYSSSPLKAIDGSLYAEW